MSEWRRGNFLSASITILVSFTTGRVQNASPLSPIAVKIWCGTFGPLNRIIGMLCGNLYAPTCALHKFREKRASNCVAPRTRLRQLNILQDTNDY